MQSPWQTDGYTTDGQQGRFDDNINTDKRGSLGQFIERSTSAPPPSSSINVGNHNSNHHHPNGDSLVGNDLLEHMSRGGVGDTNSIASATNGLISQSVSSAMTNHGSRTNTRDIHIHNGSASAANGANRSNGDTGGGVLNHSLSDFGALLTSVDNSGRATAPSSSSPSFLQSKFTTLSLGSHPSGSGGSNGSANQRNTAATSMLGIGSSSPNVGGSLDQRQPNDPLRHHDQLKNLHEAALSPSLASMAGLDNFGIVRSQSAAPALHHHGNAIGPPRGLGASSAGAAPSGDAHALGVSTPSGLQRSTTIATISLQQRPQSAGVLGSYSAALRPSAKTLMDLIQEDKDWEDAVPNEQDVDLYVGNSVAGPSGIDRRSVSPTRQSAKDYGNISAAQFRQQQEDEVPSSSKTPQQITLEDAYNVATSTMQGLSLDPQQVAMLHQPQLLHQQQHQHPAPYLIHAAGDTFGSQPQQQQATSSPEVDVRQQTPSLYSPMSAQQPSLVPTPPPHAAQQQNAPHQQLYYGGQQQRVEIHPGPPPPTPTTLQAQLLPSGQTVYVNAPTAASTSGPQGASSFGYTNLQYHHAPPQPQQQQQQQPHHHIFHQTVSGGRSEQQYVSVVPVQNGGHQLTYWQPDMTAQQQGMSPTVTIINPGIAGTPIAMSRLTGSIENHHQAYGRSKGGRSRRPSNPRRGAESKGSGHSPSSQLLEEFRSTKNRDWTIRQIDGHVVEFCQDQNGSRFIQQRLEMGDSSEQEIVMRELLPQIRRLRNDVFGNYVVQKLLDFGTPKIKAGIRDTLEGEMLFLSLQMYGCRVVQKALEALNDDDIPRLLLEFRHNVLSCIHDQNGNHVIQKCIEVINTKAKKATIAGDEDRAQFLMEQIDFIIDDVLVNASALSCHPYGCRVLQRMLEHCDESKKTIVLDEVHKCHQKLLDDQYGNYVIQHVIQFGRQSDRDSILSIVVQNGLLRLSRQKFASNVVEKLLKFGNGSQRCSVVREMLKTSDDPPSNVSEYGDCSNKSVVLLMVRDAYANYVVQTTLDVVPESDEKRLLLQELTDHSEELKNYTFAKHIVTKLATMIS